MTTPEEQTKRISVVETLPPWARDAAPKGLGSYEDPIALWGLPDDVDADAYDLDACDATIYDDTPVQSADCVHTALVDVPGAGCLSCSFLKSSEGFVVEALSVARGQVYTLELSGDFNKQDCIDLTSRLTVENDELKVNLPTRVLRLEGTPETFEREAFLSSLSELLDVSSEEIEIVSVKRGSILVEVRLAAHLEARLAALSAQELASFVATVQTTYEARKASGVALGEPLEAELAPRVGHAQSSRGGCAVCSLQRRGDGSVARRRRSLAARTPARHAAAAAERPRAAR